MKRIHTLLTLLLLLTAAHGQTVTAPAPKHEVRAVWLTTLFGLDWPRSHNVKAQRQQLVQTLDQLQQAGINTVLVQARVRATTIYPSTLEPWDGCLTGTPGAAPGYDPLQLCIELCHERGMECHAWVVTIPVGKWNSLGCKQLRQKHPQMVRRLGEDGFMNPELPETGDYLARICQDIVKRYDVDGIHLDYIRYPENWKLKTTRAKGREHITGIVRKIHKAVKAEKPWVKLSCSPIGKHDDLRRYKAGGWNARTAVCQDAQAWLRDGLMDALFPMMYFQGNQFFPFAIDWQEQSGGRMVVPGLGIYFLDPREGPWQLDEVRRQMSVLRQLHMGHCYFRSRFFTDNVKGIYDFARQFDATPALVPPMTWAGKPAPKAPDHLLLSGHTLSWSGAVDRSGASWLAYNIYASDTYPVDVSQACHLVATRIRRSTISVPETNRYYAVTAMDRYGQESQPVQLSGKTTQVSFTPGIIRSDGRPVRLPAKGQTLDARHVAVETLTGQPVAVFEYGELLSVEGLPNGMYQLRALGSKGRAHRIGFLAVKR